MATIPELASQLAQRLGPSRFWTSFECTDALLEAVRIWQGYTGFLTHEAAALTDSTYASVPRQVAWPVRVRIGGAEIPRWSLWELDEGSVGWEGVAASSTGPTAWASHGMGSVALTPAFSAVGDTVFEGPENILRGHAAGVELSLSAGDEQAILDYAQHYLSFKEGPGELDNTDDLRKRLVERGGQANARLRRLNFYRSALQADRGETLPGPQRGKAGVDWVRGGKGEE